MTTAFLSRRLMLALGLSAFWAQSDLAQDLDYAFTSAGVHCEGCDAIQQPAPVSKQITVTADSSDAGKPDAQSKEAKNKSKRSSFVIAPIPISNPALGSGIVPVVAYIFPISKKDEVSLPSVVGAVGLITNNGSQGLAIGGQFYFAQNAYKVTSVYFRGNLNYDLYGSGANAGLKFPLKQTGQGFQGDFLRHIGWSFFLGPRFIIGTSTITARKSNEETAPPPPDLGLGTNLTAIGIRLSRDSSENRFYPTDGSSFGFTSDFFSQSLGSKYSFQSYKTFYSKYWNWKRKDVLAFNSYSCITGGKPPFYGNCIYGSDDELRGYVPGKYFDRYTIATQLEYRRVLPFRLGVVGFGGVGEAIPGGDKVLFTNNSFLPAGGVGLRFLLSKQHHVNLRSDVAWGKDGHVLVLSVSEAF